MIFKGATHHGANGVVDDGDNLDLDTILACNRLRKHGDDIVALDASGAEALGPRDQRRRVDRVLRAWKGEGKATLDQTIGIAHTRDEIAHALGNVIEQLGPVSLQVNMVTGETCMRGITCITSVGMR